MPEQIQNSQVTFTHSGTVIVKANHADLVKCFSLASAPSFSVNVEQQCMQITVGKDVYNIYFSKSAHSDTREKLVELITGYLCSIHSAGGDHYANPTEEWAKAINAVLDRLNA
ncbi:hypothetical protein GR28A_00073 [Vibrio phage vB_VcorM_GR28A]|nr:hypothetical protein GR28A_00073 [Vibrio phage vB_VcorM_GR28A]